MAKTARKPARKSSPVLHFGPFVETTVNAKARGKGNGIRWSGKWEGRLESEVEMPWSTVIFASCSAPLSLSLSLLSLYWLWLSVSVCFQPKRKTFVYRFSSIFRHKSNTNSNKIYLPFK